LAINEAHRLRIPVVGVLDTNCDPDDVDYAIPANDDAIRAVRMMADFVADAIIAGGVAPVTTEEMAPAEAAAEEPAAEAEAAAEEAAAE
jgi:small subunit ribosomal protein S2